MELSRRFYTTEIHLNFESICSVVIVAYAVKTAINKIGKYSLCTRLYEVQKLKTI